MNKSKLLYLLVAVMLLPACSKDDQNAPETYEGVEVVLGAGYIAPAIEATTKAAVIDANDGQATPWLGLEVGVYGLAKNVAWDFTTGNLTSLLNNEKGTIAYYPEGQTNTTIVQFNNTKYYPMGNEYNYSFYAYYPYSDKANNTTETPAAVTPVTGTNSITLDYTINGKQDIMWGMKEAELLTTLTPNIDGYNARYFRKGGTTPSVAFNHLLTRLKFNIKVGDDTGIDETYGDIPATALEVTNITVKDLKTTAKLTIAGANAGTLAFSNTPIVDFTLCNVDGTTAEAKAPQQDAVDNYMGESIMLEPGLSTMQVSISVAVSEAYKLAHADAPTETFTTTLTLNAGTVNKTFEKGKSYKVNVEVSGLRKVKVEATLVPWDTTGRDIPLEVN